MEQSRLAPGVQKALAKIGRTIPRIGLKAKDEKKIKAQRKKRPRRGTPRRNIRMVTEGATPEQARKIEMEERAKRREERSKMGELRARNAVPIIERSRTTTNVSKTKAAAEKRERRRQRRFNEAARGGWKR